MHKFGDHSKAICNQCKRVVQTTFVHRDLSVPATGKTLREILVAVCHQCGETVAMPAVSTETIRKQTS